MQHTPAAEPSGKRATISDVARLAGTSKSTVSFVLNGRPGVAQATVQRVLKAIEELDFQPSNVARSLSNSQSGAIGLVIERSPEELVSDAFFAPFIAGVESGLTEAESSLLLRFVQSEDDAFKVYSHLSKTCRADGVIVSDLRHGDPRIPFLADLGLPAVTLNTPDTPSPFVAVCNHDAPGIYEAAALLADLGHRRIAHITGPTKYLHTRYRDAAWREALDQLGLELTYSVECDFTAEGGARGTEQLLSLDAGQRPTALVYDSDTMAMAGVLAAKRMGLQIPEDVSVVGFDDAVYSSYMEPALTTIRTDPFSWGNEAARALIGVINGRPTPTPRHVGSSSLVHRDSVGPAPLTDPS